MFIAVGAGLAFLALAVAAWRGLVAWSLHRSVCAPCNTVREAVPQPVGNRLATRVLCGWPWQYTLPRQHCALAEAEPPASRREPVHAQYQQPVPFANVRYRAGWSGWKKCPPPCWVLHVLLAPRQGRGTIVLHTLDAPSFVAWHQNRDSGSSRGGFYNHGGGVSPPCSPMLGPGVEVAGASAGALCCVLTILRPV